MSKYYFSIPKAYIYVLYKYGMYVFSLHLAKSANK